MNRRRLRLCFTAGLALATGSVAAAADAPVISSRMEVLASRAVLALKIQDHGPYLFAIDTGGHLSLIDDALARSIGLKALSSTNARGVGGSAVLPLYLAHNVVFGGGAVQPDVAFAGMAKGFNGTVRGTLAAGILTTVDSDLDFQAGEWRAYPRGRPDRSGFVRMANAIVRDNRENGGSPKLYADGELNGRRLHLMLDTGAPFGLSLKASVARQLGLWDDRRPWAPQGTQGIGGSGGIGREVRTANFTFAGKSFPRPVILIRGDSDQSNRDSDGTIGIDILRQYVLSTEPRTRSVWLKPFDAQPEPDHYSRSGLWLDQAGTVIRVAAVGTGSPAAAAGIKVGDQIAGDSFIDVLMKISRPVGSAVTLNVVRGGRPQSVSFTLANYL